MRQSNNKIRVRFAPSPTGYLHIGGLRTALYNYLFAKKNNGAFVLRIEDTDQKRLVPGALENLVTSLNTMGITYDEGIFLQNNQIKEIGGFGPYIQSKRLEIYKKYADELVKNKRAYPCFCTLKRLTQMREKQNQNKQAPKYDKCCLALKPEEIQKRISNSDPYVLRLNVSPKRGEFVFDDTVRGKVKISASVIDDQVLMKSDGFPTYHLANVVDDHLMEITHVIRGEEWLPSTPKHILLYEAFGWQIPQFAHLPLILNPDKSKLSKRQNGIATEDYLKKGYLKETLINFIALLGWNPGQGSTQEIFLLKELEQIFDLQKIHKAGAVFDLQKLDWMNSEYIKQLTLDELYERSLPFFELKEFYKKTKNLKLKIWTETQWEAFIKKVLMIERERLAKLSDVGENNLFFFTSNISYNATLLNWKQNTTEMTEKALTKAKGVLEDISEEKWSRENLEKILMDTAEKKLVRAESSRGDFLWPLRVALTGAERSPSPFEIAWVLGKNESLKRIKNAIELLK